MHTSSGSPIRFLIINPNTTTAMTEALRPVVESLKMPELHATYFTCPSPGIPSINSPEDAVKSAELCLPHLLPLLSSHDAFLVACYSRHPLVAELQKAVEGRKFVTGIFEASVLTSLGLLSQVQGANEGFGIVSTGKVWKTALEDAVADFLGTTSSNRFLGGETTGLNADQFHDLPADEVRAKMKETTKRLLKKGNVGAICLGCAGMAGLNGAVREACIEELGDKQGERVKIVDGVMAGVGTLVGWARAGF